jgi:TM2 domain-containing membrane protein YozV
MTIKCSMCGTRNEENLLYCVECGARLPAKETPTAPSFTVAPVPPPPTAPYPGMPVAQKSCPRCQTQYAATLPACPTCGFAMQRPLKDKTVAGLFALFLGAFGAHKFYLGQTGTGVLYLLFFWCGIPSIVGFIEGIILLTMNENEFHAKYG